MAAVRRPAWWSPAANLAGLLVVLVALAAALGSAALDRAVTEALIYVVAVVGLQIFVGNSGVISFGHVAFMLIAAYATAWQTCCPGLKPMFMPGLPAFLLEANLPVALAAVLAGLLAATFAALTGAVLMRLSGVAASIALFALLATLRSIYQNWDGWTGGASSIIGLPLYVDVRVAGLWAVIAVAAAVLFRESRFGLMLRASKDEQVAAQASGVDIFRMRLLALVLSAFFVGIAGVLMGHYLGTLAVQAFWLDTTFITLAMLVIGGMTTVTGAVAGVAAVRLLTELLRQLEQGISIGGTQITIPDGSQEVILAVAMVLVLIHRPGGLLAGRELRWPLGRRPVGSTAEE